MPTKQYEFKYDSYAASADFEVNTDVFTPEIANLFLEFQGEYDEDEDPIEEALKKLAMQCIKIATTEEMDDIDYIARQFKHLEGWIVPDGKIGVKLTYVDGYNFDELQLEMNVK